MKIPFLSIAAAIIIVFITAFKNKDKSIEIKEQGSIMVGGTVISEDGEFDNKNIFDSQGQTLHGDHAYIFYQIPTNTRKHKLVFLHGADQSSKAWETTPDGREGFQNIFLRKKYSVYLVDQPRRGKAGRSTVSHTVNATPNDQLWYSMFRIGNYPKPFDGVQFATDKKSLDNFFRQITPNTGPYDPQIIAYSISELFNQIDKGILITHSQGGGPGWYSAIKNPNIKAVIAFEPGSGFVFPKGEAPQPMPSLTSTLTAEEISLQDFMKLTHIPIIIYYGDNIPETPSDIPGLDNWRVRLKMAKIWAETVNKYGGDAKVVHLPEVGIFGNTHFLFADLNNQEIADIMENFLEEKGLN